MIRRAAVALLVAGAVLVAVAPASAGHHPASVRLERVPLQSAQLGAAGVSFALNLGSGEIANWQAGLDLLPPNGYIYSSGYTDFTRLGRVDGYALDYGDEFAGSTGVMEIRSGVEEYATPADAKRGLNAWRKEDARAARSYNSPLLPITVTSVKPSAVGKFRFADLITLAAPNLNPIVKLDEQVTYGRYILDLTVTAGSESAAEEAAPHLLHALSNRLRRLLGGHKVAGGEVELPPQPPFGRALGGPALSDLILEPADVGQPHPVYLSQGYSVLPPALSAFVMDIAPAGIYDDLQQQVGWWPTATEAMYGETYEAQLFFLSGEVVTCVGCSRPAGSGSGVTVTPVDLSAVGDGAVGYIVNGFGVSQARITLANGRAGESIEAVSKTTLQASDVQSLAQAAADRLDAGLAP
ncbi:MAG TPA: hypothetical protein VGH79_00295 [Gaiellaceae bacterium]